MSEMSEIFILPFTYCFSPLQDALTYIETHMPKSKKLVVVYNDEWKEFLSRPSLKYILRLLTGKTASWIFNLK